MISLQILAALHVLQIVQSVWMQLVAFNAMFFDYFLNLLIGNVWLCDLDKKMYSFWRIM